MDKRLITGTRSTRCFWLFTNGPSPFCVCKPFSCKACSGIDASPSVYAHELNKKDRIITRLYVDDLVIFGPKPMYPVVEPFARRSNWMIGTNCTSSWVASSTCQIQNPDTPRAGRVGQCTTERLGTAGPGRMGRRWVPLRMKPPSLMSSRASNTIVLDISSDTRTSKTIFKPNAGTKYAVDNQFTRGMQ